MSDYIQQALDKLEEFEGVIPWMYRDTVGRVTVGVGLMLPDAAAAQALPFQVAGTAVPTARIAAEFARVDALPMGRPALFYRIAGGMELEKAEIDSLLRRVVLGVVEELQSRIAGFDSLPVGVKLALIDMAYNLGIAGLMKYTRMIAAVDAGDWSAAAAASFRHGPGAARNEWTRQMLLGHVLGQVSATGDSRLKQLGYGLVGMVASWLGR